MLVHIGRRGIYRGRRGRIHADDTVLALELEIGEPAHRLGGQVALRGLVQIVSIALRGTLEAVLEINVLDIRRDRFELGQGATRGRAAAAAAQPGYSENRDAAPHGHSSITAFAWAWVARS